MSVCVVVSRFRLGREVVSDGSWSDGAGVVSRDGACLELVPSGDRDVVGGRADTALPVANLPLGRRLKILEVPCVRQTTVGASQDVKESQHGAKAMDSS